MSSIALPRSPWWAIGQHKVRIQQQANEGRYCNILRRRGRRRRWHVSGRSTKRSTSLIASMRIRAGRIRVSGSRYPFSPIRDLCPTRSAPSQGWVLPARSSATCTDGRAIRERSDRPPSHGRRAPRSRDREKRGRAPPRPGCRRVAPRARRDCRSVPDSRR
jgi:hypothetical protein